MEYDYYVQATFHGYQLVEGTYDDAQTAHEEGEIIEFADMTWRPTYLQLDDTNFKEIESKCYPTPQPQDDWTEREDTTLLLVETEGYYMYSSDNKITFDDITTDKWKVFVEGVELELEEMQPVCALEIYKGQPLTVSAQ